MNSIKQELEQLKITYQAQMRAYTEGNLSYEQYDLSRTLFINDYDRLVGALNTK
jgi:hypothetical protein